MPYITIHLTQEQINDLLQNKDIVVGASEQEAGVRISVPAEHSRTTIFELFTEQISRLRQIGSLRTAETYTAAFRKFRHFRGEQDILPCDITADLMEAFQNSLKKQQLSMNTISFHLRKLRAIYNKAAERGLTADLHPFRHVYTGIAKTVKRAITIREMKCIKEAGLSDPLLCFSRDMFLFSFYTRGMAFVDMAYLRKSDIKDGTLTYMRKKTGQQLTIRWERMMQQIVDRYAVKNSEFLLPIIHFRNGKERNQYRNVQTKINRGLKEVARVAGVDHRLTMYVARHTWATIARQMKVPIDIISSGMGHTNEKTTEIYLKSIDMSILDNANWQIIESI